MTPSPVHVDAARVRAEWSPAGELLLWGDVLVIVHGPVADIRALLTRALDLSIPKGEDE